MLWKGFVLSKEDMRICVSQVWPLEIKIMKLEYLFVVREGQGNPVLHLVGEEKPSPWWIFLFFHAYPQGPSIPSGT